MEEKKVSEQIIDAAISLEEKNIKGVDMAEIKRKIDILIDYAIKIEEYELANTYYDKYKQENNAEIDKVKNEAMDIINEINNNANNGFRVPAPGDLGANSNNTGKGVFDGLSLDDKIDERDTISDHLKKALELLKEKGRDKVKTAEEKSKVFVNDIKDKITNMYNSAIDFANQKKEDNKEKIAAKKEERRLLKEKAIEQLKELGKEDEFITGYEEEAMAIEDEIDAKYDRVDVLKDSIKETNKNTKALTKYEKKSFISRFLKNFSELDGIEEYSDEQKRKMIENGELPKKNGFFSKVKQAFSKTKDQGKEIKGNNEKLKEDIMAKYEQQLAEKNSEIEELENILAENEEQREVLENEKKEKLVEIVKTGKLKLKELQEMVDNEIVFCSNPTMIIAKAKVSTLKDKFSRIIDWGKEKVETIKQEMNIGEEVSKSVEKETSRNSGMDR